MNRTWFRKLATTGAALSVGSLAFLYGCNHNDDCDCPQNGEVIHTTSEAENVQRTEPAAYEVRDSEAHDVYFRDHRHDANFDRDAYFLDRGAYIRVHEGDAYWNDHRADFELNWSKEHDLRSNRNESFDRKDQPRDINKEKSLNSDRSENRQNKATETETSKMPSTTRSNDKETSSSKTEARESTARSNDKESSSKTQAHESSPRSNEKTEQRSDSSKSDSQKSDSSK